MGVLDRTLDRTHKVPSRIVLLDEIPRTGPGKFKKKEWIRVLE